MPSYLSYLVVNLSKTYSALKKYKEAIDKYDKVVEEDKKYYNLAESRKKECIKLISLFLFF